MAELKMTNNPCKYCNGEIDEGKPLCGDIVDKGDVVNIVKTKEGYEIELWRNFELVNSEEIYFCPKCGRKLTDAKICGEYPRFGCATDLKINDEMDDVSDWAKDAAKKMTEEK